MNSPVFERCSDTTTDPTIEQAVTEACNLIDTITQFLYHNPSKDFDRRQVLMTKIDTLQNLLDTSRPKLLRPVPYEFRKMQAKTPDAPARRLALVGKHGEKWSIPHKRPRDSLTPSPVEEIVKA